MQTHTHTRDALRKHARTAVKKRSACVPRHARTHGRVMDGFWAWPAASVGGVGESSLSHSALDSLWGEIVCHMIYNMCCGDLCATQTILSHITCILGGRVCNRNVIAFCAGRITAAAATAATHTAHTHGHGILHIINRLCPS